MTKAMQAIVHALGFPLNYQRMYSADEVNAVAKAAYRAGHLSKAAAPPTTADPRKARSVESMADEYASAISVDRRVEVFHGENYYRSVAEAVKAAYLAGAAGASWATADPSPEPKF